MADERTIGPQPLWLTVLKGVGVLLTFGLIVRLGWRVAVVTLADGLVWPVLVALALGWAAADLVAGSVHWFCDSFFSPETPILGPVILRFRDHHVHPQHIVELGFLEQDINNILLALAPVAWMGWRDLPATGMPGVLFVSAFIFTLTLGTSTTNLLHKWAHDPDPPAVARWLQRTGLVLSPEHHGIHHRDYSRGFCVTSGWMNRVLDPIDFFSRTERGLRALLSAPPLRFKRRSQTR